MFAAISKNKASPIAFSDKWTRSFISNYLSLVIFHHGVDLVATANELGHANATTTTASIYAHQIAIAKAANVRVDVFAPGKSNAIFLKSSKFPVIKKFPFFTNPKTNPGGSTGPNKYRKKLEKAPDFFRNPVLLWCIPR